VEKRKRKTKKRIIDFFKSLSGFVH